MLTTVERGFLDARQLDTLVVDGDVARLLDTLAAQASRATRPDDYSRT